MKHSNDHFSTSAWIEELQSQPHNPVLLYKPQGVVQSDETDNLGTNDFLLVLQTPSQRDVLKQYGGKAILMDATHSTTQYDFLLITIMVIDDYGEGVPVAWAISNSENTTLLVEYLKAVRTNTGDILTEIFMSDCADQYFVAWSGVFSTMNTRKLLCMWHIDRAWCKALNDHIRDK